jgi:P-type Ca2+ transporter type 2C
VVQYGDAALAELRLVRDMIRKWHALSPDEVTASLSVNVGVGLKGVEATRRLSEHGTNEIQARDSGGTWQRLTDQFGDVLIWTLLVAAAISGAILDEWIDAGVILAIVVVNAGLGFVQESRADRALSRLREMAAPDALVLRDGTLQTVASRLLVPGDVLVLEAGSLVAADARLVEVVRIEMDESSLTGESFPAAKQVDRVPEASGLGDQGSMVFSGTHVASGRGRGVVVATGDVSAVGRIAGALAQDDPDTPLQIELDSVGRRLGALAVVTASTVFLVGWLRGNPAESMFLMAVALAVAAIPEGLPAIVTITLSGGVQRMADRQALVRRLPAVEALGAATVICTDKTGTLTRNEIRVQEVVLADRRVSAESLDFGDERDAWFVRIAALCGDATFSPTGWIGDPTETALAMAISAVDGERVREQTPRIDEFAFDSKRKRMSTVHRWSDANLLIAVKGAPEEVVARCTSIRTGSGTDLLSEERKRRVLATAADLGDRGWRTLALAYRVAPEMPSTAVEAEDGLVLVAVVGMSDEIRPEAARAVAEAQAAGIVVVMVTGDHEVTARSVAAAVGILRDEEVMPGSVLRDMTAQDLAVDVERYRVYSRIDPLDKVKIVEAWRLRGHIVAMTGDGVNDAPALQSADIGVAMGSGTDVSREAAAMVLADDNFATIVAAVREGRSIFRNLRTVVSFLLGSNASEVFVMLVGFLVFGALGEPLLATQLLWINLVTDGLPALALGVDPPHPDVMTRGPETQRHMLQGRRLLALASHGAALAFSSLGALAAAHYWFGYEWETVRTIVFTTLVLSQLGYAVVIRRSTASTAPGPNRLLGAALIGSAGLQLAVVYTPVGQTLFDTVAIPLAGWLPVFGAIAVAAGLIAMGIRHQSPDHVT